MNLDLTFSIGLAKILPSSLFSINSSQTASKIASILGAWLLACSRLAQMGN